ncbi:tellurite resistance TerB family protein [Tropicimonas sp.]|uniref:tellurite resistance TerB family protein n=1 Tax=Tropicimonas sp. TaxID=2067044 RepID=UPI003A852F5C
MPQYDSPLNAQDALVALMIGTSVSDENIRTSELMTIERIVNHLPVFADYDAEHIRTMSTLVFDLFEEEEGVDALLGIVQESLPERLYETAYALCCDVAASDGWLSDQELRMLEEIRHQLAIPRLNAAAIERGARARHMKV